MVVAVVAAFATSGCSTAKQILGVQSPGDPSVTIKAAETRWLLIKNPRFGEVASEPEYVWVEEDKMPITLTTLVRGQGAIIATPEIVAKYGAPPGGGKISPRQGVPTQTTPSATGSTAADAEAPPRRAAAAVSPPTNGRAHEGPKRGLVVYVDTPRIVVDLTAADGMRAGTLVSVRRDAIPIVHPVTGEVLGELDQEVATVRLTEVREKFSVGDVQTVAPGARIQIKDRVVPK
ncbi:MAG: hypothetical protein DME07_19580 [Candidatus Rokuibacteriota bacterium]|nr:MAG: hypothetical protein DME07_19580 [Candidatus Rokubacteria bacterium]PYN56646.1 MAG: hypothetical protein DMD94_06995 [Candidatus Rokubacteria bacterium]